MLVNDTFCPVEVRLNSKFCDQIWCKVKIKGSEELYIGVCYRSPNVEFSDRENDTMLCNMLNELHGKTVLLMGDFNYPDIDWSLSLGSSSSSQFFVDCVDDGFLT